MYAGNVSTRKIAVLALLAVAGMALNTGIDVSDDGIVLTGYASNPCDTGGDGQDDGQTADSRSPSTTAGSDVQTYGAMGGGSAYVQESGRTYSQSSADAVASSKSDLMGLESMASSGEVVFVPEDTSVTLTDDETITVPDGVTLASNRGSGGDGAWIEKPSAADTPAVEVGSNAKFTGFRVRGDDARAHPNDRGTGGVGVDGKSNAEIFNNEITGFAKRCVIARDNTHVHHNVITYCNQYGYGYGVSVSGTEALIEYNRIDYYRHASASYAGQSYILRYNVIGPHRVNHDIDMHADEGSGCENEHCGGEAGTMTVHHNTLTTTQETSQTGQPVVNNRGVSPETTRVCSNWIQYTQLDNPIWQMEEGRSSYENMVVSNNRVTKDNPGCSVGAPRESCPTINADGPGC